METQLQIEIYNQFSFLDVLLTVHHEFTIH